MKKFFCFLLAALFIVPTSGFSQSVPKKMNYQAVARDANGKPLSSSEIALRIGIMSSIDLERPVYAEEHTVTTNKLGLFNIQIGDGKQIEGSMEEIDWGGASHFLSLQMDIDGSGNFEEMGISQLLTVPYAFYAEKSGSSADGGDRDDPDDWTMNGNAGTDDAVNFIGTTDAQDFVLKTNGTEVGRFNQTGQLELPTGSDLTIGGANALNMDGTRNIHIGQNAGAVSTGDQNAFIGYNAGQDNTTGAKNTFIGPTSGRVNTTGSQNAFIGGRAGFNNTAGNQNSFIGWQAGRLSTTGNQNTFIGKYAGQSNTTGSLNTYIGSNADGAANLTNATAIGAGAIVTQDNSLVLGNGAFVGIGTGAPAYELDVVGTVQVDALRVALGAVNGYILKTDASGNASWINPETANGWQRANNTTVYNTGDSVGINTSNPLALLHIMGSTTMSRMMLSPNEPFSGDDASIVLTEDDDDTYHMEMTYDGGDNRMYWYGKNNATLNGPHLGINRDNGRVGIGTGIINPVSELEVVGTVTATAFDAGDASGLTNVYADSLRGSMQADTNDILQWNGAFWDKIPYGRYAFHASASTDQTIGDTAYDTLRCNNSSSGENFEYPAGVYDNATYGFIVPVDGIYFFEAAILWDNVNLAETRNAIFIRVNNTDEVGEWSASGGLDFFGTGVSTTLELNAGDEVRVRVYNGDGADMDSFSQSGKYCYFSGYMVFAQ